MKPAEVTLPSNTEIRVARTFDGPVQFVWRAFTEPDLMQRWLLGPPGWTMPVCEMDVRPGGKFRWRWKSDEDGKEFGFFGEYQTVEPLRKIVHTECFDPGDLDNEMAECLVTATFEEARGATTMTTTISYSSKEDRDAALATGMTDGMEMSYQGLDTLLASNDRTSS